MPGASLSSIWIQRKIIHWFDKTKIGKCSLLSISHVQIACLEDYCHKCSFAPANICVLLSFFIVGMCFWGEKNHYNISIRNLISKINQFSIYILKAVVSIFCIIGKMFFFCVCVCSIYLIYIMPATFTRKYNYWERSWTVNLGHYLICLDCVTWGM